MCDKNASAAVIPEETTKPISEQPHSTCTTKDFADGDLSSACGGSLQELIMQSQLITCTEGDVGEDDSQVSDGSLGTGSILYSDTSLSELTPFDPLLPLDSALQCLDEDQMHEGQLPFSNEGEEPLPLSQESFVVSTEGVTFEDHVTPLNQEDVVTSSTLGKNGHMRRKKCKSVYKHVPHREKPPHLVARRNARERRRVQSVNVAFTRLRKAVPCTSGRSKRVSKVKTLQGAMDYIQHLQELLKDNHPGTVSTTMNTLQGMKEYNDCNLVNVRISFGDEVAADNGAMDRGCRGNNLQSTVKRDTTDIRTSECNDDHCHEEDLSEDDEGLDDMEYIL